MALRRQKIFLRAKRHLSRLFAAAMLFVVTIAVAHAQALGPQGAEGAPERRQDWRVPSADSVVASRALVFRPQGEGPFRLALIATRASTQNPIRRAQMKQPEYRAALAAWLVARAVCRRRSRAARPWRNRRKLSRRPGRLCRCGLCALRRGDRCVDRRGGRLMRTQPFVRKDGVVVIGHSAGGCRAPLAMDARNLAGNRADRGVRTRPRWPCRQSRQQCLRAGQAYRSGGRLWPWRARAGHMLAADNISYFSPALSRRMADAVAKAAARASIFACCRRLAAKGMSWLRGTAARISGAKRCPVLR